MVPFSSTQALVALGDLVGQGAGLSPGRQSLHSCWCQASWAIEVLLCLYHGFSCPMGWLGKDKDSYWTDSLCPSLSPAIKAGSRHRSRPGLTPRPGREPVM